MLYKRRYVNPVIDGKMSKSIEDNISKNVWHENIVLRDIAAHEKFINRNCKAKKPVYSEDLKRLREQEWIMPRH
jgi:hypothetical protein